MRVTRRGVLAGLTVLFVALVCVRLGFWQLERLEIRRATNAALERARSLPPLTLDSAGWDSVMTHPERYLYRRAELSAYLDPSVELLLRGRSDSGRPGVHLVTAGETPEGRIILVNRGWLPASDGLSADPRPYRSSALLRLTGLLQAVPSDPEGGEPLRIVVDADSVLTLRRLDREAVEASFALDVPPLYLELLPSSDEQNPPLPVPEAQLDEGPHLGYAVQWFTFAGIAVLGYFIAARRIGRQARKDA